MIPAGEREEVRQLLTGWDLDADLLERVVDSVTKDRNRWVELMMQLEHGFSPSRTSPARAGVATFTAFIVAGIVPLVPFVVNQVGVSVSSAFAWSTAMTVAAFFAVGMAKGLVVAKSWWRSGAETLAVGGLAAALAYTVGIALGGLA